MGEIEDLNNRLSAVIRDHCNTHGCADCGLKFTASIVRSCTDLDSECSATDLQKRIMDIEFSEVR